MTRSPIPEKELASLLSVARESCAAATNSRLRRAERVQAAGQYLETVAELHAANNPAPEFRTIDSSLAGESLRALDPEVVERAADDLVDLLHKVIADPHDDEVCLLARDLERLLLVRHGFGRRIEGAELLGLADAVTEEQRLALQYFDATVRPWCWAMSFANETRLCHARRIARDRRSTSWWWSEGLDVDWHAVQLVTETAELIARYRTFERYVGDSTDAARARRALACPAPIADTFPGQSPPIPRDPTQN